MKTFYYRCNTCLTVGTVQQEKSEKLKCSLCNEIMEEMGHVFDAKLVKEEERSVCDERCTRASGPSCDCKCNGANHGSHLTMTVKIIQGDIPELNNMDGMAVFRRNAYLKASKECKERLEQRIAGLNKDQNNFRLVKRMREDYKKACDMKVHTLRLKRLRSLFI